MNCIYRFIHSLFHLKKTKVIGKVFFFFFFKKWAVILISFANWFLLKALGRLKSLICLTYHRWMKFKVYIKFLSILKMLHRFWSHLGVTSVLFCLTFDFVPLKWRNVVILWLLHTLGSQSDLNRNPSFAID